MVWVSSPFVEILSASDLMQSEYFLRVMLVLMMIIVMLLLVLLVKKKETTIDCGGAGMWRRWYMVFEVEEPV